MPSSWLSMDDNFPTFTGEESPSQQIAALHNYLYQMREGLQYSMRNLTAENFNEAALQQLTDEQKNAVTEELQKLRSTIDSFDNEIGSLSARMSSLENLGGRMNRAEDTITLLEQDAEEKTEALRDHEKSLAYLEKSVGQLPNGEQDLVTQMHAAQEEICDLQADMDTMEMAMSGEGGIEERTETLEKEVLGEGGLRERTAKLEDSVNGKDTDEGRNYSLSTEIRDGYLSGKASYSGKELTLDSVAYDGKTYRDIFVTGNIIQDGDFESGIPSIGGEQGTFLTSNPPVIQSEICDSGTQALLMDTTAGGSWITLPNYQFPAGHCFYSAFRAKMESYTQGQLGVQSIVNNYAPAETTLGSWVSVTKITDPIASAVSYNTYIGCMRVSSKDGLDPVLRACIDNVCLLDLTAVFGDSIPDKGQMDVLYERYIRILRGDVAEERIFTVLQSNGTDFVDEACIYAFMRALNDKAQALGMKNSRFRTPSGLVVNGNANICTAADAMKLLIASYGHERIAEVLGRTTYTFRSGGVSVRELTVQTLLLGGKLSETMAENGFYLFGGKGGSLGTNSGQGVYGILNDALLCGYGDKQVALSIMGEHLYSDPVTKTKNSITPLVVDIMKKISGSTEETPDLDAAVSREEYPASISACVMPAGNWSAWATVDAAKMITDNGGYSSTPEAAHNPASVTKLLTAIVVVESVDDLEERIEVHAGDYVGGSGQKLNAGETFSYWDLLHLMLMESNNQAATALARAVGHRLLSKGVAAT